ncbi:LOW QUALITY PROTEIN: hypothetical protein ACHAW6_004727 [Cyclotella cf. meneghiniana]
MLDSGASKMFVNLQRGMQLTRLSNKVVITADGTEHSASHSVLLPTCAHSYGAREAIVIPGMQQKALQSVGTLENNGYTTVFLPGQQGMQIYHANNPQRVQDDRGLWMVLITGKPTVSPSIDIAESTNSVYELPSTKEVVPACSIWISNKGNIAYRSQAWQPCHFSQSHT